MSEESRSREKIGRVVKPAHSGERSGDERAARYAQQRLKKRKEREVAKQGEQQKPKKKLTGMLFYMMLSLTVFKDLFDYLLTFSVVLSFFIVLINFIIMFVVLIYYFINDIKLTSRKLVIVVVGFAVEMIPIMGLLPMTSISLIMVRKFENSERLSKIAEKRVGFAV